MTYNNAATPGTESVVDIVAATGMTISIRDTVSFPPQIHIFNNSGVTMEFRVVAARYKT